MAYIKKDTSVRRETSVLKIAKAFENQRDEIILFAPETAADGAETGPHLLLLVGGALSQNF